MQLHQLRYIVEVEQTGSISKAAERLFLTQPSLSAAISELEKELGIKIFNRTNRGVFPTHEGVVFLSYAKAIVNQVTNLEHLFTAHKKERVHLRFAWSVQTFNVPVDFIRSIPAGLPVNISLMEGTHLDVINWLARKEADIGTFYVPEEQVEEYEKFAQKQNLIFKRLWALKSYLLMSDKSKLASYGVIDEHMITDEYIQLVYRPASIFDLPNSVYPTGRMLHLLDRKIYFNDRAIVSEVLSACPNTYVHSSLVDAERLGRYGLTQRPQKLSDVRFVKAVIYPEGPLTKEIKWVLKYLEDEPDILHPHREYAASDKQDET